MRLNLKHFFTSERHPHSGKKNEPPKPHDVEWSPEERIRFQQKLKSEKKTEIFKIIIALAGTVILGGLLFYFIFNALK